MPYVMKNDHVNSDDLAYFSWCADDLTEMGTAGSMHCWCDGQGFLYMGPVNEPRYAISSWNCGFDLYRYDEYETRLVKTDCADIPLDIPLLDDRLDEDVAVFIEEIPVVFREAVEPIPVYRALMLRLMKLKSETVHLAISNPALLLLLLDKVRRGEISDREAAAMVIEKRRDIARFCRCQAGESAVRILSRITINSFTPEDLNVLRHVIQQRSIAEALCVHKVITPSLLSVIHRWPWLTECDFFRMDRVFAETIYDQKDGGEYLWNLKKYLDDTVQVAQYLGIDDIHVRVRRMTRARSLVRLHDKLTEDMNRLLMDREQHERLTRKYKSVFFPQPPLPGNADIRPILTIHDLIAEGQQMNHCVASYADRIMKKQKAIYRVLHPQRCTLSIKVGNERVILDELRAKNNDNPFPQTVAYIKNWINKGNSRLWDEGDLSED